MSETVTIELAGQAFEVRRLTLRQARALGLGVLREAPKTPAEGFAATVDQAIAVIVAALSRDHSEITTEALLDMEMPVAQITQASDAILTFAGYLKKAPTPGEPVPDAASTGQP